MAYPRPAFDSRPPHDIERTRPAWDPLRPNYSPVPPSIHHNPANSNMLDPESDNSDVSDDAAAPYRTRGYPYLPVPISAPPPKRALESLDSIEGRLRELQQIEDLNIQKQDLLKAKRARKDERIMRKREAQDAAIKLIMEARARRDERVIARRRTEDEAFEAFDRTLEAEENNLHRQKKRLKRGLPVDDVSLGSRISSASMSPPGPAYANIPPPAKRHQAGPPGQNNSPITSNPRPIINSAPGPPTSVGPNPPPYAFLQSSHPPSTGSYGQSPTISHSPPNTSSPFPQGPRPTQQQQGQPSPYAVNGHPPSPQMQRPLTSINPILNTVPPPRVVSTYDTRPPPPQPQPPSSASSGFATINAPSSGFASINARSNTTPPASASAPLLKTQEHDRNGYARPYVSEGTPTGSSAAGGGKRTPSTTHPYQMSEAFANRHHHCERTDNLARGIWTSYGHGGTKELPTGPAQEMYLRCNHDGCRRIDWRTVHGLQCHIVKNHEQPKGTIGSLEKALERYGVPVAEIEAYEREHGEGTGGTMADPKNLKLKAKPVHLSDKPDGQRRSVGPPTNSTPGKVNTPTSLGGVVYPHQDSPASIRSLQREETGGSENSTRNIAGISLPPISQPSQPSNRFAAVNGAWSTIPDARPADTRDVTMKDAPAVTYTATTSTVPQRNPAFYRGWPEVPPNSKQEPAGGMPVTNTGNAANAEHGSSHDGPTLAPLQEIAPNVATHNRSSSTSHGDAPQIPTRSAPITPVQIQSKETPPVEVQVTPKQQGKDTGPPIPKTNISNSQEGSKVVENEEERSIGVMSATAQLASVTQANVSLPGKDVNEVKPVLKEPERPKIENVEPQRIEPRSPMAVTRRASLIGGRRESSRRSSVAAAKAEKEREKEREEAAAAAATKSVKSENVSANDIQPDARPEKKPEVPKLIDIEQEKESEKDEQEGRDDESDDPDTIKVGSASSRDRERELRTTPKRQSNGRFVRKQYR